MRWNDMILAFLMLPTAAAAQGTYSLDDWMTVSAVDSCIWSPDGAYVYYTSNDSYSPDGRLLEFVYARRASLTEKRKWELLGVEHKKLDGKVLVSEHEVLHAQKQDEK